MHGPLNVKMIKNVIICSSGAQSSEGSSVNRIRITAWKLSQVSRRYVNEYYVSFTLPSFCKCSTHVSTYQLTYQPLLAWLHWNHEAPCWWRSSPDKVSQFISTHVTSIHKSGTAYTALWFQRNRRREPVEWRVLHIRQVYWLILVAHFE